MMTLKKSIVVKAALASLFAAAAMPVIAADMPKTDDKPAPAKKAPAKKAAEKVHCFGINSCKGKSECAVDGKSACAGQNACKGQGWITLASAKKCTAKKGTVVGEKKADAPAAPAAPAAK